MSKEKIIISESELEIMRILWESERALTLAEILLAAEAHGWKKTTVSTFLARLCEKGAVMSEKCEKLYHYSPLITIDEYREDKTDSLIKRLYHGSAKELCAALFQGEKLSSEDIDELRAFFERED